MRSSDYAYSYAAVVDNKEYYRIFTAGLTHYGFIHILFNMCWAAVFGYRMEKQYGTIFMFALAFWIQLLGMLVKMAYVYARLQIQLGHAQHLAFENCAGYSIVLFGLITIECTQ